MTRIAVIEDDAGLNTGIVLAFDNLPYNENSPARTSCELESFFNYLFHVFDIVRESILFVYETNG